MKIVQLIAVSNHSGGDQTHVLELVQGLAKRGNECVVLIGPADGRFEAQLKEAGVAVYTVPSMFKPINPWRDSRALFEIVFLLRRIKPDLVASHTSKAGFLARMAGAILGIPTTFTPHGWSIMDRGTGRINTTYRMLERIAGRLDSSVIAVAVSERDIAIANGLLPGENIYVVHNGIANVPVAEHRPQEPPVIIMVARFQKQKDQATLLRAIRNLGDVPLRVRFVGGGPLLEEAKELAATLGITDRVEFLGERSDTPALLAEADIFVLSSNWEAFPISVLEAMRAGLPIVVSNVGGSAEAVIEGETGFVVPRQDDGLMANALSILLKDPALHRRLGANARELFLDRFTLDPMIDRTLDVYRATRARKRQCIQI